MSGDHQEVGMKADGLASDRTSFLSSRLKSFGHAWDGIVELLRSQPNARVHAVSSLTVALAGFGFDVSGIQWCLLILAVSSVWAAEAFNTALEYLCDVASPEIHPLVKRSKDVAAAAVLLSALGAAGVGLLVFLPSLLALLGGW